MANGLRVVSIRIRAITQSAIGEFIDYYDNQTGIALAKAILKVNISDDYDGRSLIENLDSAFIDSLRKLL